MSGRFLGSRGFLSEGRERASEERQQRIRDQAQAREGANKQAVLLADLPEIINARVELHHILIDKINIATLEHIPKELLREQLLPTVRQYLRDNKLPLNTSEMDSLIDGIVSEMLGLGPIEPLLDDDSIADILIVGPHQVFVERFGQLEKTHVHFKDEEHLMRIINRIVSHVGRHVDEASPMVDARLADGSRVNIAIRPIAIDGPQVSIRKFSRNPLMLSALVKKGALTEDMANLLAAAVEAKISIVVSGGTGSGKTTLLNALSNFIPANERLVTIEDAAELQLQQAHVVRMETRPATLEGKLEIKQRDLVTNALRMRPDRIIIGEVRGSEAFDMLQAMNTGHEGSLTTIHANTPRDAVTRIEQMVAMAGMNMSEVAVRQQIASAIQLIVQVSRLRDGSRRVIAISEITGMEGDVLQMHEIMHFEQVGIDQQRKVIGSYMATGVRPKFLNIIEYCGIELNTNMFDKK
jgi:pilus assembly protein CpaF